MKPTSVRDEALAIVAEIIALCSASINHGLWSRQDTDHNLEHMIGERATELYELLNTAKEKELSVGQKKRGARGTDNPRAVVPNARMLEEWQAAIVRAASREEVL